MGEVVGAALVAHVPTIVLPLETRMELNEGKEISLVPGLHRLRSEVIEALAPDTIIVFDTHWFTTVEYVVSAHERRSGKFTSGELPRGMSQVPFDFPGDPVLANLIAEQSHGRDDMWITPIDDPYLPLEYATVNLLGFLQGKERWVSISNCQTADASDHLLMGTLVRQAIERSDRRVFLLASGAMSHSFHPLRSIRNHESSDPAHIFSPEARVFDQQILRWWANGDHASVIDAQPEYAKFRPEGRFGHYLAMVGALGGRECEAVGVPYSAYENAVGTAQIHVNFELKS